MRRRLALLVASTTSLVVIAFLLPLALLVRELAEDRAVSAATQEAQNVALLVGVLGSGEQLESVVGLVNDGSARRTTVFLPGGAAVGAPARRTANVERAERGLAFDAATAEGREALQPVATGQGRAVVRTLVPEDQLRVGVRRAWLTLLGLGAALIAVAVFVADRLARGIARPLRELADAARQLGEGRLETRVEPVGPREVVELGAVVNRLAGRIRALLAAEREIVADLSHRLRTPITALRLDSEGLRDPQDCARLTADVDALEVAVNDVIREARRLGDEAPASADAVAVVRERVDFWSALAEDQGRRVEVELPDDAVFVAVSAQELGAALDGLLQNVLSHTPEGTGFSVRLTPSEAGAELVVSDEGPGWPQGDLLARGSSGGGSTGLGLDIARRTAEASRGSLAVRRGTDGGAVVQMVLGSGPAFSG